jgi:uncharacterized damage-inducible protein DinB
MSSDTETLLITPPGFRSAEVARFLWQMDDQRRALLAGTRGLTIEELSWQPAPGVNTIGMLLAHIAVAEAHLAQIGLLGEARGHPEDVTGLTAKEEGMPLAADARPSPALDGKGLAYFDDLLARARAHTRKLALELMDADLDRKVARTRPDGSKRVSNVGWMLYHMLEHEAGHRAQIAVLRHLYRATAATR